MSFCHCVYKIYYCSFAFKNMSLKNLSLCHCVYKIREFGIRKGLKKLVISSKIRIFIGENQ